MLEISQIEWSRPKQVITRISDEDYFRENDPRALLDEAQKTLTDLGIQVRFYSRLQYDKLLPEFGVALVTQGKAGTRNISLSPGIELHIGSKNSEVVLTSGDWIEVRKRMSNTSYQFRNDFKEK